MKRQSIHLFVAVVLALLGPLAQKGRGNFILWNDESLTVNSSHSQGILYDTSRVFIVLGGYVSSLTAWNSSTANISGGSVSNLYAYNSSDVNISGGGVSGLSAYDSSTVGMSDGSVSSLTAWNSSTANISGGSVSNLYARDSSAANISGGSISNLTAYNSSTANISVGSMTYLYAYDSSTANISGGSMAYLDAHGTSAVNISGGDVSNYLKAHNSSTVNISGGSMSGSLYAYDSSTIIFHGRDFRAAGGLVLDGEQVLGTGILSCEWFDGTRWAVNIAYNEPTATILAIPESEPIPFCVKYPRMDFNGDCKVDFADFAIMASSWLECNLVPQSACWE